MIRNRAFRYVSAMCTDVCVVEARWSARRGLGVGYAGGLRLRCLAALVFLAFLGFGPQRIAIVGVDQFVARLGPM